MRDLTVLASAYLLLGGIGAVVVGRPSDSNHTSPSAADAVIRMARSENGLNFVDTGDVFLKSAAAPDVVVLANGDLLAVFDYADLGDPDGATFLAISRSSDSGRTWSSARRIRLLEPKGRATDARHGDLVRMPDGRLRLYFVSSIERRRGAKHSRLRDLAVVRAAERRDGSDFPVDPRVRVIVGRRNDAHPVVGFLGRHIHLFAAESGRGMGSDTERTGRARHFISRDGRQFVHLAPVRAAGMNAIGSVVSTSRGLRAYVSSGDGIRSLVSTNGRTWKQENGVRLANGWDPAVVQLKDGSYLMLYCAALDGEAPSSTALVEASGEVLREAGVAVAAASADASEWELPGDTQTPAGPDAVEDTGPVVVEDLGDRDVGGSDYGEASEELSAEGGAAEAPSAASEQDWVDKAETDDLADVVDAEWYDEGRTGLEDWDPILSDGFAPKPDFKHKIDYFEWYKRYALGHPADNAYKHYMRFMPGPNDEPGSKPDWPELNHMFNGDYDGPPTPWNPADHPEWEETHKSVQSLLEQFCEASTHAGYATPAITSGDGTGASSDSENLLLELILPSLSPHRHMVKATLADAWRMEDGRVSPERMLDAWRTCLQAASHLHEGATLIEDLVEIAERAQVQETARWALKHEVFSGDELQSAFDTLREYDRGSWDMTHATRGEHAMAMDFTQWLFSPPTPDGQPSINIERAEAFSKWDWVDEHPVEPYTDLDADDVYATIEAFDTYYRQLTEQVRFGYPEVRTADVEATHEQYHRTTPVTEMFIPNLSRAYQLGTRSETSRRATQLAYATHLLKERNGRWPQSLDEMPVDDGDDFRIDPFTGDYFGYQLTDDGPRIYTRGENALDDGGVHSRRWSDKPVDGSDDHVFWPPQRRR